MADESLSKTVHVSNLDNQVSEPQLRYLFGSCGQILSLRLMGDGVAKRRYAFVEYSTPQGAATAMNLNSYPLGNSILRVSMAKTPPMANKQAAMQAAGGLPAHIAQAMGILPNQRDGTPLTAEKQDALGRTVHVSGLDLRVGERELAEFFQTYAGAVLKLRLGGDTARGNRFAFVEFVEQAKASLALQLSESVIGANAIKISMAKSPILTDQNVYYVNPPPGIMPGMFQQQQQQLVPAAPLVVQGGFQQQPPQQSQYQQFQPQYQGGYQQQPPQQYQQQQFQQYQPHPPMHSQPPLLQSPHMQAPMQGRPMLSPQYQPIGGGSYQPPIRSFQPMQPQQPLRAQPPPHMQGGPQIHAPPHLHTAPPPMSAPAPGAALLVQSDSTSEESTGVPGDASDKKRKDLEDAPPLQDPADGDENAQKKVKTEP
eukprot:TRINITY_DN18906_c0_g1_i1.p1 TRINITY_DN18906_c0_g1~~TRINITY_DN18906_c0_g1_i1.p1  ORF type:complete len:426 (-),score=158.77 TRINITY_DN18906_c0_g1_i1:174-1451(-)